jgi:hypothetical protein
MPSYSPPALHASGGLEAHRTPRPSGGRKPRRPQALFSYMLGFKAKGREVIGGGGGYQLKGAQAPYNGNLAHENEALRLQNEYFWEDSV